MTTQARYTRTNVRSPVLAVRCPTSSLHQQVMQAAKLEGITTSQWLRRAIQERLKTS